MIAGLPFRAARWTAASPSCSRASRLTPRLMRKATTSAPLFQDARWSGVILSCGRDAKVRECVRTRFGGVQAHLACGFQIRSVVSEFPKTFDETSFARLVDGSAATLRIEASSDTCKVKHEQIHNAHIIFVSERGLQGLRAPSASNEVLQPVEVTVLTAIENMLPDLRKESENVVEQQARV